MFAKLHVFTYSFFFFLKLRFRIAGTRRNQTGSFGTSSSSDFYGNSFYLCRVSSKGLHRSRVWSSFKLTSLWWPLEHLKIPVPLYESLLKEVEGLLSWVFIVNSLCMFMFHYALNSYYVLIHPEHMQHKAIFFLLWYSSVYDRSSTVIWEWVDFFQTCSPDSSFIFGAGSMPSWCFTACLGCFALAKVIFRGWNRLCHTFLHRMLVPRSIREERTILHFTLGPPDGTLSSDGLWEIEETGLRTVEQRCLLTGKKYFYYFPPLLTSAPSFYKFQWSFAN